MSVSIDDDETQSIMMIDVITVTANWYWIIKSTSVLIVHAVYQLIVLQTVSTDESICDRFVVIDHTIRYSTNRVRLHALTKLNERDHHIA